MSSKLSTGPSRIPSLGKDNSRGMAAYHNSRHATESSHLATQISQSSQDISERLLDLMQQIHAGPRKELSDPGTAQILAEVIARKAFTMFLMAEEEVDLKATLAAVGLDSLMATQLTSWWRTVFRVEVSVLQVTNAKTFEALGLLAVAVLKRKVAAEEGME